MRLLFIQNFVLLGLYLSVEHFTWSCCTAEKKSKNQKESPNPHWEEKYIMIFIFFRTLKFSSHLKAAQYYGIALTIRSIVLSVISAHFLNNVLTLEARDGKVLFTKEGHYDFGLFCKCSIAFGILGQEQLN